MVGWRSIRLQSPSIPGWLLTLVLLGTIAGTIVLIAIYRVFAQSAVPATAVRVIDPRTQLTAFNDFYQQVLSQSARHTKEAVPWRVFPPQAFKQYEPYELAAYVKLSYIGLNAVLEDTTVQLLLEVFPDDIEQLQALFEHGVAPLIHVVRVHIPGQFSVEDRVEQWTQFFHDLRQTVRQHGGNAEIWVQRTHRSLTNAERVREHLLLRHSGADKVNVSSLSSVALRQTSSSLLALAVDVAMTKQLENDTYLGQLEFGDGIWALLFARDGEPILVVWSVDDLWTFELPGVSERVETVNLYGQTSAALVHQDRLRLEIGPEPIWIRGLDGSWIARAVLESGVQRFGSILAAAAEGDAYGHDVTELVALTHAAATDIWHMHAQAVEEISRSADGDVGAGRVGWQVPTVIGPFGPERPPQPEPDRTLERWERVVDRLFAAASEKAALAPANAAWPWGELDALPLLVELIAALGHPWGGDEAQGYVEGTGILVHEAAAYLHEATHGQGRRFETQWLLERALHWLQRAEQSADEAAAAAWAIIARETAVLAVERSSVEVPLAQHLLLAAPFIELEHRLGGNLLDVPLFGVFVRGDVMENPSEWQLRVETPPGWQWQAGSQEARRSSGEAAPVVMPAATPLYLFADSLGLVPLHLRLLVPPDTPAGRYPVHIRLIDPTSGLDAITLYVTIR